jgi:ribosomal protein S18 acetylase RimI-like enzyme
MPKGCHKLSPQLGDNTSNTSASKLERVRFKVSMRRFSIRTGAQDDLSFLVRMLYEAFSWRPDVTHAPIDVALARREISRYIEDWGRSGDVVVVAVNDSDAVLIGAAWYRLFPRDDPGYGYVGCEVPELSIGVEAHYRGSGVGQALLEALIERARADGFTALSLSVEPDNRIAVRLYERLGFRKVGMNEGSLTMALDLTDPGG